MEENLVHHNKELEYELKSKELNMVESLQWRLNVRQLWSQSTSTEFSSTYSVLNRI